MTQQEQLIEAMANSVSEEVVCVGCIDLMTGCDLKKFQKCLAKNIFNSVLVPAGLGWMDAPSCCECDIQSCNGCPKEVFVPLTKEPKK